MGLLLAEHEGAAGPRPLPGRPGLPTGELPRGVQEPELRLEALARLACAPRGRPRAGVRERRRYAQHHGRDRRGERALVAARIGAAELLGWIRALRGLPT